MKGEINKEFGIEINWGPLFITYNSYYKQKLLYCIQTFRIVIKVTL